MSLEQRVTALEKEVADLKRQLDGQPKFKPSDSSGTIYKESDGRVS